MSAPVLVLAGVGLISATLLGIFTVFVIGIHRCDRSHRGHLFHAPQHYSDALTRRTLVGTRYSAEVTEEDK
jgi:hypothetical protein